MDNTERHSVLATLRAVVSTAIDIPNPLERKQLLDSSNIRSLLHDLTTHIKKEDTALRKEVADITAVLYGEIPTAAALVKLHIKIDKLAKL